jgi:hypothetical protein
MKTTWEIRLIFPLISMRNATEKTAKRSQPTEQAGRGDRGDKEADVEINTRVVSKEKLNRRNLQYNREATTTTTYQRSRWTTPREVWDPGGFQQWSRGAHEQGAHDFPSSGV